MQAIPSITSRVVGPDLGGEFADGAVTTVQNIEAYRNHPAHLAMDRAGLPLNDRFVSYDTTARQHPHRRQLRATAGRMRPSRVRDGRSPQK
ncbi:hypothetical protein [Streptomyces sp. NPDC059900]